MTTKKKSKVLVIGGSGFVGAATVLELIENNFEVVVFDQTHCDIPNTEFIQGSILDKEALLKAALGCEYIYHFAGWANMATSHESPFQVIEINVMGTTNVLEVCAELNIKKFVFASSMYVFSKSGSFYRTSKQCCELIIEEYAKTYQFDFCILRYGSLYGPGATHGNAVYELIKQALEKKEINYWGTGEEIRQYIHVKDAAKGSVKILADDFKDKYISLTGLEDIQIKDLLKMIKEILGGDVKLKTSKEPTLLTHYMITPFNFLPKTGRKLIFSTYKDLGQGILECIHDIYNDIQGNSKQ